MRGKFVRNFLCDSMCHICALSVMIIRAVLTGELTSVSTYFNALSRVFLPVFLSFFVNSGLFVLGLLSVCSRHVLFLCSHEFGSLYQCGHFVCLKRLE